MILPNMGEQSFRGIDSSQQKNVIASSNPLSWMIGHWIQR